MKALLALILICSNMALAEPGFWPLKHEKVPEKVRLAAKSVYEVYLPSDYAKWIELREVPSIRNRLSQITRDERKQLLIRQELNQCEEARTAKCFLTTGLFVGATMFSLEDGRMASVVHSIQPMLERALQQQHNPLNLKIPAVIRIGANSYKGIYLKISKIKTEILEVLQQGKQRHPSAGFANDFDGVILTIEGYKPEGGLKIAKEAPAYGELIYALGFPEATNNRMKLLKVPDSNGVDLRVMFGPKMDFKEVMKEILTSRRLSLEDFELANADNGWTFLSRYISFAGDGAVGMSGGPIVDSNGDLVGITHSVFLQDRDTAEKIKATRIMGMDIWFLLK